jgi:hypothetical protein
MKSKQQKRREAADRLEASVMDLRTDPVKRLKRTSAAAWLRSKDKQQSVSGEKA